MDIVHAEGISGYKGDDFDLEISAVTLERIEAMTFPSLKSFFSSTDLLVADGGPYTGGQIYRAVRKVLRQRFKNTVQEEKRMADIAALQAKIDEIKKDQDAVLAPLYAQIEALMHGTATPAEPTPIKPPAET